MDFPRYIVIFIAASCLLALASPEVLHAHRPVIVKGRSSKETPVVVTEPEISWAYYGELGGAPHYYTIASPKPFTLYANILVPDPDPKGEAVRSHDMSFEVLGDGGVLFSSEGVDHEWRRFYEPYGRDHYYVGPEFETNAEAGAYTVRVYNTANSGRYALAIGKTEKFTFFSLIGAVIKASSLDRWFFKK